MLRELEIESYAVVEKLRVSFHCGLNLLTGETGSGKSIVVDALALLLGARSSPDVIRAGAEKARIAGLFELGEEDTPERKRLLETAGIDSEDSELLVEREISANGKSRAALNGRLTTAAVLRDLAPLLAEIHGQHEQQNLFRPSTQLEMIDQFSGTTDLREKVAGIYRAWTGTRSRLDALRGSEQEKLRMADLWRFQKEEIAGAALVAGEDERLQDEKRILSNLTRIQQAAGGAYEGLYDSADSAAARMKGALRALEELARYDAFFVTLAQPLESARISVEDAAHELRKYLDRLDVDPGRLAEIEDRLALIERLKRKYGATIGQILDFGEQVSRRLQEMESGAETISSLEADLEGLASDYRGAAQDLSQRRRKGAERLAGPVVKELAALAMERSRFEVVFEDPAGGSERWAEDGIDKLHFRVSANPGEPPRPLEQVASGGELSRITLAIKTCLSGSAVRPRKGEPPRTLVFDEIDAGIGGRAAEAVGRRLHRLSASHQLLCVTHLPQIAAFADHHYSVGKRTQGGRTVTVMAELEGEQRIKELARMLSGETITPDALRHARQLTQAGRS